MRPDGMTRGQQGLRLRPGQQLHRAGKGSLAFSIENVPCNGLLLTFRRNIHEPRAQKKHCLDSITVQDLSGGTGLRLKTVVECQQDRNTTIQRIVTPSQDRLRLSRGYETMGSHDMLDEPVKGRQLLLRKVMKKNCAEGSRERLFPHPVQQSPAYEQI